MVHEKDFEDIIAKYPELIEDGLTLKGRQVPLYGRRMDLLFEDKFKRKLIVELKIGPIKDAHIGQILSYEGMLLSAEDPTIRVMLIGNRVPPNIKRSLDHHGIAWCEITLMSLKEFLIAKNDTEFLSLFEDEILIPPLRPDHKKTSENREKKSRFGLGDLLTRLKSSVHYINFKAILQEKIENEEKAKEVLIKNMGKLENIHLNEVLNLVDEPYPYLKDGKISRAPWFGRLLKSNTYSLFEESEKKLNKWFSILTDSSLSVEEKFEILLHGPYRIRGLNVGFITLMLYILDKKKYAIWFEGLHNGLMILFPDLESYNGSSSQYLIYCNRVKELVEKYGFDPTELDWILSTGIHNIHESQSGSPQNREIQSELPNGDGFIDRDSNPFSSADWIRQNRPLTTHRKTQLAFLFNKDIGTIRRMRPNNRYAAFVGIRWGFAFIEGDRLIETEKWKNRYSYDDRGNPKKIEDVKIPGNPKSTRLTKKSVCLELISRQGGASISEMARSIVDRGIDSDFEKNSRVCRLWMSKIGVPVTKLQNGNYIKSSLL
ncbi:MAG TPA: hypothetical protein PLX41_11805 [Bacteroidales bacterium]|nr:hypothetical protein [Bacteroidales bacterium]